MAKQIRRELVLCNFRPIRKTKKQSVNSRRARRRPGNDPTHLENIRMLPCCVCGSRREIQAHHLKCTGERGMGMKSPDKFALPLCAIPCHHEVERIGSRNEENWFLEKAGFDCLELATVLWSNRGNVTAMLKVLLAHTEKG